MFQQQTYPISTQTQAEQAAGGNASNLTGDAFLGTLDSARASLVKQIGEGRQELTPTMMRSKDGQLLAQQIATAYPDYDASLSRGSRAVLTAGSLAGSGPTRSRGLLCPDTLSPSTFSFFLSRFL